MSGHRRRHRKYHLPVDGIKLDAEALRKIGVRGDYENESRKAQ